MTAPDADRRTPPTQESLLARRALLLLALYVTVRAVFLVDNRSAFADSSWTGIAGAFLHGLRFDLSAIAYSNLPFVLLSLAPAALLARRWYQRALFAVFVLVNATLTVIMMGDVGYFPFTGTRVTLDVFALSNEAQAQAGQLFVNFAGLTAIGLALIAGLVFLYPRARDGVAPRRSWLQAAGRTLGVVLLTFLAARGGWQKKPLKPIHAFAAGEHALGILTLNSAFTMLHSESRGRLTPLDFFASDAEVEARLPAPYGGAARVPPAPRPQNVVLLVLESFGTEYWGADDREAPELTPFLDSLAQHGVFYRDAFANGRRSMDALPSLLLGVPLYYGRSIAVSAYQGNEWRGLGHFLAEQGYHSSFFHGAPKGTMFFDAIAAMSGIEEFIPLEAYPDSLQRAAFDGHWGLFDEPALQYAARTLSTHREPWFTTLFTISTHHPYRVPERYRDSLPTGTREIHQSVAYVDLAVRRFFEAARQQPWFAHTLFVITGDHTAPLRAPRYDTPIGRYLVPVLLYHPTQSLAGLDSTRIIQHADLFKTILDYAGARPERVPRFGQSLFADAEGEAVLSSDETFWLVRREGVLERLPDGQERSVAYSRETTGGTPASLPSERVTAMSAKLKAQLQHFVNSMVGNSFYRSEGTP
ncbi:MAG: LTA synthase family protein [Gemmatimonadaceae bacterium]|nr:LTA synthase family protein [Gemmatimonadaceae bacterium]